MFHERAPPHRLVRAITVCSLYAIAASWVLLLQFGSPIRAQLIPTIAANDPSVHLVMPVLDTAGPPTAIHAFAFESRSRRELQPTLLGIR